MSLRVEELRYGVPFGTGLLPEPTDLDLFREKPREELYFLAWLTGSFSPRALEQELGLQGALETYRRRLGFMTQFMSLLGEERKRRNSETAFSIPEGVVFVRSTDPDYATDSMLIAQQENTPILGERMYRPAVTAIIASLEQISQLDHPETRASEVSAYRTIQAAFRYGRTLEDVNTVAQVRLKDSIDFLAGSM